MRSLTPFARAWSRSTRGWASSGSSRGCSAPRPSRFRAGARGICIASRSATSASGSHRSKGEGRLPTRRPQLPVLEPAVRQDGAAMKAVVRDAYGSVDVLRLGEVDKPVAGDGEVLVRVHAAGVDQGVWHLMVGMPYVMRLAGFGIRAPKNPLLGYDVAGRVDAVGTNAGSFRPGDEVFGTCRGSFAEYAVARADRLASKPENVSFEEAAAVPISGYAALQAVRPDRGGCPRA